jgi:hypothetical protein
MVTEMTPAAKQDSKKPEAKQAVTQQATPAVAQPTTTTPKPEPGPSKQEQTLTKLKVAWTERKVDLSKLETRVDGKFLNVKVGEGWPLIVIGQNGGLDIPQVKSFPKAWDAALIANELFAKQLAREAKKATSTTPAPKPVAAVKPEEKKESPTARKQRVDSQIESKLQSAGA